MPSRKFARFSLLSLLLLSSSLILVVAQDSAWTEKLKLVDRYRLFAEGGFSFEYVMDDSSDGRSAMHIWLKSGDSSTVLCSYTSPARLLGRRILVQDGKYWLLDRNMRDPIRISARQILFGEASAGEITRLTFSGSYRVAAASTEGAETKLKLEAVPGSEVSYPAIDLVIKADDFRPLRADLYAATGTLMRSIKYERYESVEGRELLVEFRILNPMNSQESVISLGKFSPETVGSRYFSREGMKVLP